MFLTRMSTYMNSTSYIHTEVKHEDATESLQTNAKDERKVAPPPTNAKERILKFDQIHQHPVDLWVIILPTQTVHFPLMKIPSNYQTIFHIKLDPPKNLGQKIPRSDPWIQNTKNVPPHGAPVTHTGAHLVGRCCSEKLHLPFFSGQASNGIRHCYLDSHGATHLGEPRVFSKTHGSEFPLFDRPKNQRGKTLEFMHQRFGSQTRWKKVTGTPFFFWPKSSTLDPSSFQAKALFVRFATAHG